MAKESLFVVRDRLDEFLTNLSLRVKNNGQAGMNNIHKQSESVVCNLMNVLFGFELQKEKKVNAAGFDLCDPKSHILVQVTGNCTDDKISDCLRTTANRIKKEPHLMDAELYIVFLTVENDKIKKLRGKTWAKINKGELKADGFRIDAKSNILCLQDFVQFLTDDMGPDGEELTAQQVEKIQKLLDKHPTENKNAPALDLPIPRSLGVHGFLGRDKELEELEWAVDHNVNPIEIWGLGGQGKTELAIRFGRQYQNDKHNVYWVTFSETFWKTITEKIAAGIPQLLERGQDSDSKYGEVMKHLRQCSQNDLLIIDNVEWVDIVTPDPQHDQYGPFDALCGLPMHLILTARTKYQDGGIEIKRMDNEVLYGIFERHSEKIEKQKMDALIDAVDGHTMAIDLIARTLHESYGAVTPEMILQKFNDEAYPDIGADYGRKMTLQKISEHIGSLFTLIGLTDTAKQILCYATLLPEDGMESELFRLTMPDVSTREFQTLDKRGFLRWENGCVTIHPVVRMICREKLNPTEENCEGFLNALWAQFTNSDNKVKRINTDKDIRKYIQGANCFMEAYRYFPERTYLWVTHADELLDEIAETYITHEDKHREGEMIPVDAELRNSLPRDPRFIPIYTRSLKDMGQIYHEKGEHDKMLENQEKIRAIEENKTPGHQYFEEMDEQIEY